jgi:hypothetical protein
MNQIDRDGILHLIAYVKLNLWDLTRTRVIFANLTTLHLAALKLWDLQFRPDLGE